MAGAKPPIADITGTICIVGTAGMRLCIVGTAGMRLCAVGIVGMRLCAVGIVGIRVCTGGTGGKRLCIHLIQFNKTFNPKYPAKATVNPFTVFPAQLSKKNFFKPK